MVTGSDLNVKGDLYNNVEGDVVYQAATSKGYERSSNKSSGFGVGVYADSKSQGFTVNANTAKGYGNGETTTNANSHVTVGGTTYQNIGGDLVLDGAVVKGDHMSGHIDGAILSKSRQDTAIYQGKQTNAGVSADIGFDGVPQSVSVNAGRSKVNADYAAVKEQTGIAMNSSDVVVAKASRFDGAYFTTATPEANKTVFKEGVTTTDIQNHMNYKGDAINVGLGAGINPETQKVSPPGISGIGYGKDGDSQTSTTYGAVTGMAGKSDVTTANVSSLNKPLENSFDKTAVEAQLGAQVQVSQAFDTERRTYRLEMAREQQKTVEEAKKHPVGSAEYNRLMDEANKQQQNMVLFDSITGAIYGPNTNGVTGYVARAVAPQVSYQIGQYFKGTNGEGTAPHILAHGILAAAVSVATGNDPTTGALSAMGAEAAAPMVAKFLFGDKPISELTAEEKATVSSITSLAGLGLGATTGEVGSAVSAQQTGQVAVDDNDLTGLSSTDFGIPTESVSLGAYCSNNLNYEACMGWVKDKSFLDKVVDAHHYYNDMTIFNISEGPVGYTIIVNNKNGKVYRSTLFDVNAAPMLSLYKPKPGGSINFGSIKGGYKTAEQIDNTIVGASVGAQACYWVCGGISRTQAGDVVYTYGGGTPQVGVAGSQMKYTGIILTPAEIKKLAQK